MIEPAQLGPLSVEAKRELVKTLLSLRNGGGVYPLSPGQQALWLVYQLAPSSSAYHFLFAARLPGDVDLGALAAAFHALLCRHPALRTRFTLQDGKPVQHIEAELHLETPTIDASSWADDELLARLRQRGDEPFDLE